MSGDLTAPIGVDRWHYCPVCERTIEDGLGPGPGGRPNASCPHCGSLERHRHLACLLGAVQTMLSPRLRVLEVSPSPHTTPLLQRLPLERLTSIDVDPAADRRKVQVQASLTALPFSSGSVDLLVCFHVLEHIPDDQSAIREIHRVLAPHGVGMIQVPWRAEADTDEDPTASAEERTRRFGQADHVRYYGRDFEQRLRDGGLEVTRSHASTLLGESLCAWVSVPQADPIWLVRPSDAPGPAVAPEYQGLAGAVRSYGETRAAAGDTLEHDLMTSTAELQRLERQLRVARRRIRRLRRRAAGSDATVTTPPARRARRRTGG